MGVIEYQIFTAEDAEVGAEDAESIATFAGYRGPSEQHCDGTDLPFHSPPPLRVEPRNEERTTA